ncbi:MAG: DNA-binding transcriptional LysR family regulator [Paracoccaceae bacterium]
MQIYHEQRQYFKKVLRFCRYGVLLVNWDDLKVFLAVARAESLSGAAKHLQLDPATISRRIARLEGALETALFLKSPQGYILTTQGARILSEAERAEAAIAMLHREAQDTDDALTGQIRIGAPDGVASFLLPQVCAEIARANPDLEIQVVALPRVFNLSKREADMAITVSPPETGRLTVRKIADYRLHLMAARGYLAAHPPIVTRADLAAHPVTGYIADMIFDPELDYLGGLDLGQVGLSSNSVVVQLQMLRNGGGIGIVHDFARSFAPELELVLPDQIALKRAFYMIRHADERGNERLNRFARLLGRGVRHELHRLEDDLTDPRLTPQHGDAE